LPRAGGLEIENQSGTTTSGDADHHRGAGGLLLGGEQLVPAVGLAVEDLGLAGAVDARLARRRRVDPPSPMGRENAGVPMGSCQELIELARALDVLGPVRSAVEVLEAS
jgi:hypothetical protein